MSDTEILPEVSDSTIKRILKSEGAIEWDIQIMRSEGKKLLLIVDFEELDFAITIPMPLAMIKIMRAKELVERGWVDIAPVEKDYMGMVYNPETRMWSVEVVKKKEVT